MATYQLDTDISSCIMKRSHATVLARLQQVPVSDVCISVNTKAELLYGVEASPRRAQDEAALTAFLKHGAVLDFSGEAARAYAEIRAALKLADAMIGGNTLLIAAHARSAGLTLVTNNVREFSRVRGLKIANWAAPVG